jgi:hypothetical protein
MKRFAVAALAAAAVAAAHAQRPQNIPGPQELMAVQREKMKPLAKMDGTWRGPAWTIEADGKKHHVMQTERIGPFLDGTVKVLEGRGYLPDGTVGFNAFGVVYYDMQKKAYGLRSWAQGRTGDFKFEPTADGYAWEVEFPGGKVRYVATVSGNKLREIGHTHLQGREPMQTFEMNLERIGDTDWPLTTPVPPK